MIALVQFSIISEQWAAQSTVVVVVVVFSLEVLFVSSASVIEFGSFTFDRTVWRWIECLIIATRLKIISLIIGLGHWNYLRLYRKSPMMSLYKIQSKSDWLINTQSRVPLADWWLLENSERASLNISMSYYFALMGTRITWPLCWSSEETVSLWSICLREFSDILAYRTFNPEPSKIIRDKLC